MGRVRHPCGTKANPPSLARLWTDCATPLRYSETLLCDQSRLPEKTDGRAGLSADAPALSCSSPADASCAATTFRQTIAVLAQRQRMARQPNLEGGVVISAVVLRNKLSGRQAWPASNSKTAESGGDGRRRRRFLLSSSGTGGHHNDRQGLCDKARCLLGGAVAEAGVDSLFESGGGFCRRGW